MNTPTFALPSRFLITISALVSVVGSMHAQTLKPAPSPAVDYKALYETTYQSATMWQEKARTLEKEIKVLRDQNARMVRQRQNIPEVAVSAVPAATPAPQYEDFLVEVPRDTALRLDSFGGPNVKLNVSNFGYNSVSVQVGTQGLRKIENIPSEGVLIYRDTQSGDEVYVTNKEATANRHVTLRIKRLKR